jgi:dihydroorotate dehydrogenase (fumarate)
LKGRVPCSLAASTGVHTFEDALKTLLAGADAAMMTSALLQHGPEHVSTVLGGMRRWMEDEEYDSVEQLKGSAAQITGPDPTAYERANYAQTLARYSTTQP